MPFTPHLKNALLNRGGDLTKHYDSILFRKGDNTIIFKGTGKGLPHEEVAVYFNGNPLDLSKWLSPDTPTLKTGKDVVKNIYGTFVNCIDICDNILKDIGFIELGSNHKYGKRKHYLIPGPSKEAITYTIPGGFENLIDNINILFNDHDHKERAHESLVQDFFELLGYNKFKEIKYQIGRIDVCVNVNNKPLIVTEVKRDWKLARHHIDVVNQAYHYANEVGAIIVVITNGNYYAIYNRQNGLSYNDNFVGEFTLNKLTSNELGLLSLLRKENLASLAGN